MVLNTCDGVGDGDRGQPTAATECAAADGCHTWNLLYSYVT